MNTFQLQLPPLRERKSVIPNLVSYFIIKYKKEHDKEITGLDQAAQMALAAYHYPGNIRELENIMEHAIVLSEGGIIRLEDLPEQVQKGSVPSKTMLLSMQEKEVSSSLPVLTTPISQNPDNIITLSELERQYIIYALTTLKDKNLNDIASVLGISRTTLWRKIKENNIQYTENS